MVLQSVRCVCVGSTFDPRSRRGFRSRLTSCMDMGSSVMVPCPFFYAANKGGFIDLLGYGLRAFFASEETGAW